MNKAVIKFNITTGYAKYMQAMGVIRRDMRDAFIMFDLIQHANALPNIKKERDGGGSSIIIKLFNVMP